ncbi:MAG: hypothetical protein LBL57_02375 [Tannerella sp.]|nr:hypothetical protein [Tannerella sp.]
MAVLWFRFLKEVGKEMSVVPAELKENAEISRALDYTAFKQRRGRPPLLG